jgi:hypothetical protein
MPVPSAVSPLELMFEVTSTSAGSTLPAIEVAFSEPVPLLLLPPLPVEPLPEDGASPLPLPNGLDADPLPYGELAEELAGEPEWFSAIAAPAPPAAAITATAT